MMSDRQHNTFRSGERTHRFMEPLVVFPIIGIFVLVAIWGITLTVINSQYQNTLEEASLRSQQEARTYEAMVVRALREIDQALTLLQFAHEQSDNLFLADLEMYSLLPPSFLFTTSVFDSQGNITLSNGSPTSLDFDEIVFSQPLNDIGESVAISKTETSNCSAQNLAHFARRLSDSDDNRHHTVMLSTESSYFTANYEEAQFGQEGLIAVLHEDGSTLANHCGSAIDPDTTFDFSVIPATTSDVLDLSQVQRLTLEDGIERLFTAYQLFEFPLTVVVGLSVDEELLTYRENRQSYVTLASAASAALLLLLVLIGIQSHQLALARHEAMENEKRHSAEVENLALHDALTGLPNRLLFSQMVSQGISSAQRNRHLLAVMFMDLDHFKDINDTLGHDAGDDMLKQTASRLKGCFRQSDTISRFGGDEFVALMPGLHTTDDAVIVANKILGELARPYELAGESRQITTSIGIAVYPLDGEDVESLMKKADIAMYRAKDGGRDRFEFFSQPEPGDTESSSKPS